MSVPTAHLLKTEEHKITAEESGRAITTPDFNDTEVAALKMAGVLYSEPLKKSYDFHDRFHKASAITINTRLKQIKELMTHHDPEIIRLNLLTVARRELLQFKLLNAVINYCKTRSKTYTGHPDENPDTWVDALSWPIRTHKMIEVLEGTLEFLGQKSLFNELCNNDIPKEFSIDFENVTIVGDKRHGKGNSKATFLKAVVFLTVKLLTKNKCHEDLATDPTRHAWYFPRTSGIFNRPFQEQYPAAVLPELNAELIAFGETLPAFRESIYYVDRGLGGIETPHSFYAFGGGHTLSDSMFSENPYLPKDCSAFMQDIYEMTAPCSTFDFNRRLREVTRGFSERTSTRETIITEWGNTTQAKTLKEFNVITTAWSEPDREYITNPSDIRFGDILNIRNFNSDDPDMSGMGTGGHVFIVASEIKPSGSFLRLHSTRNMPDVEGLGVDQCQLVSRKTGVSQGCFRHKKR